MLFAVTKQQQAKPLGTFLPPIFLPDNRTYAFSETSWVKQLNVLYGFHMFGLLKDFWVQMQALQSRLAWSTLGAGGGKRHNFDWLQLTEGQWPIHMGELTDKGPFPAIQMEVSRIHRRSKTNSCNRLCDFGNTIIIRSLQIALYDMDIINLCPTMMTPTQS